MARPEMFNSAAAAAELWTMRATDISLIPKIGRDSSQILNFASYQYFFNTQSQSSKFGRAGGRNLNFGIW